MILITTSHSLILLDPGTWRAWRVATKDGLYYGLTQDDEYIYVAARGRLVSSNTPAEQESGKIIQYSKSLRKVDEIKAPFPLRDMHQISIIDGKLWVTCSFDNKIAIFDGDNWEEWFPLGKSETQPFDKNHFNSLIELEEEVCILAHNKGPSELYFFDKRTRLQKKVISLGEAAHDIWIDEGDFYTCSSAEGKLLSSGGAVINVGGFPRGVVCDDERFYIGISEIAERKDRDFTDGLVTVFNKSWQEEITIKFRNEGLVLDLMKIEFPLAYSRLINWTKFLQWRRVKPEKKYAGAQIRGR